MSEFLTYKKFLDIEQASELIDLLNEKNIPYLVEDNSRAIADFYIGQDTQSKVLIKIKSSDFTIVNEFMDNQAQTEIENVDADYYLFAFENEELLEIISEPEAWCEFDKKLAKKILNQRGIEISSSLEKTMFDKRIKQLSVEEKDGSVWKSVGYIFAFFGGIIGVGIGLSLWTAKRTLPNGDRVFIYTKSDRFHGKLITLISLFIMGMYIAFWMGFGF
ncbi:MAG: hypothetical protein WCK02_03350 [Bacteroidota bacterium]